MAIFASPNFKSMIEQINDNVFRVNRSELRTNTGGVFEQIQGMVMCDASYLIARKRDDAHINGSIKLIESIENDFRSSALIIVHRNNRYPVIFRGRKFDVVVNRYNRITSIMHHTTGRETITRRIGHAVLDVYKQLYGIPD